MEHTHRHTRHFTFQNHQIRTVQRDNQTWFIATDICRALGIGSRITALEALDHFEKNLADGPDKTQMSVSIISRSALDKLSGMADADTAAAFLDWLKTTIDAAPSYQSQIHEAFETHHVVCATAADARQLDRAKHAINDIAREADHQVQTLKDKAGQRGQALSKRNPIIWMGLDEATKDKIVRLETLLFQAQDEVTRLERAREQMHHEFHIKNKIPMPMFDF